MEDNKEFSPKIGDKLLLSEEIKSVFSRKEEWFGIMRQCGEASHCGGFLESAYNYLSLAPCFSDGEIEVISYDPDLENWITSHPTFLMLRVATDEPRCWLATDRDGCVEDIPLFTTSIDHRKGFEPIGGPIKCLNCSNVYYPDFNKKCWKCE